jgi:hypothetical protein
MKPAFLFPVTSLFSRLLLAGLLSLALADTFTPILTTDLTDTNSGDSRSNIFVDFIFSRRPIHPTSIHSGNRLLSVLAIDDQAGELGGSKETTSPF